MLRFGIKMRIIAAANIDNGVAAPGITLGLLTAL